LEAGVDNGATQEHVDVSGSFILFLFLFIFSSFLE